MWFPEESPVNDCYDKIFIQTCTISTVLPFSKKDFHHCTTRDNDFCFLHVTLHVDVSSFKNGLFIERVFLHEVVEAIKVVLRNPSKGRRLVTLSRLFDTTWFGLSCLCVT